MDTVNTARYIGYAPKSLANMRSSGTGPPFIKRGRIFYYKNDVDEWLRARRVTSTASLRAKASAGFDDDIPG
jgi:hypothetical protein